MSPLDPQVAAMRARRAGSSTPPLYTLSFAEARAADIRAASGGGEPVGAVADREIPGPGGPLPIRIYHPSARHDAEPARPALLLREYAYPAD